LGIFVGALTLLGCLASLQAQTQETQQAVVNQGTVGLLAGPLGSSELQLASDLALGLNDGYNFRLLPIVGEGASRNIEDLLYLKGIDVTIVPTDVLDFFGQNDALPGLADRLRFIAKLGDAEVHLLARKEIASIEQLRGKRVNLGVENSGSFMTGGILFNELGIEVDVTAYAEPVALRELQDGTIDAMLLVDGAPIEPLVDLPEDAALHLLPLPVERITGNYVPATLAATTYPKLIPAGASVDTVATSEVLAAYNWPADHPRAQRIGLFVTRLSENLKRLQAPPFHPKWRAIDLNDTVQGWQRLSYAEQLLTAKR
jgi:TRAP-type uncharacterized transport system substrate-binding protein